MSWVDLDILEALAIGRIDITDAKRWSDEEGMGWPLAMLRKIVLGELSHTAAWVILGGEPLLLAYMR